MKPNRYRYTTCPACKSYKIHVTGGKIAEHAVTVTNPIRCSGSGQLARVCMTWEQVLRLTLNTH